MSSLVCTSSAPNGSSSSSTSGSQASARAIATRWRCPPDSCLGSARRSAVRPVSARYQSTRAAPLGPGQAGQQLQPEGDVALDRAPRVDRAGLEHQPAVGSGAGDRSPSRRTLPAVGAASPATRDSSVDLPEPLAPTTHTNSPRVTVQVDAVAARGTVAPDR